MTTKRKAKRLPDLRPRGYTFPEEADEAGRAPAPPTPEEINRLAAKHLFPKEIDLAAELTERWYWWRSYVHIGPAPLGSVRKMFLQKMALRADGLVEAISKLGPAERNLILAISPQLDLDSLERTVHELERTSQIAARRILLSPAGRRGDQDTLNLLCKLWRLYQNAFGGNAPRITRSGDAYSGKFFDFADDVLRLIGIHKNNNGLGKAIEKAQKRVAKRKT